MNFEFKTITRDNLTASNSPGPRVVVVYEDFIAGTYALHTLKHLFREVRQPFGLHNVWKFDFLAISKLREIAATEAAGADWIVISAHGTGALPSAVKSWIELWMKRRPTMPAALVTLVPDGDDDDAFPGSLLEDYLENCAARAGLDFLVHRGGEWQIGHQCDDGESEARSRYIEGLAQSIRPAGTISRWGLHA
jgi:hypothetical protein